MSDDNYQHIVNYRIYYEDTDAGGVVYYANYLKFAERARTEMLRDLGVEQNKLAQEKDILFVVRKAELDLYRPARLDDLLAIKTKILEINAASMVMQQDIFRDEVKLSSIKVQIASVNQSLKPIRAKQFLQELFK